MGKVNPHARFDALFRAKAATLYPASADVSHDYLHVSRVVGWAARLAEAEGADLDIVVPAAWLHDFVNVPKNDPRRAQASRLSADAAVAWLREIGYPEQYLEAIAHAVAAHSFSANIPCETIEAKVVQDADRLDALGAVGVARCCVISGKLGRPFYDPDDFFAGNRPLDDGKFAIDHFEIKLYRVAETMHTAAARAEAARRVVFMREYLAQMAREAAM